MSTPTPQLEISASRQFVSWLREQRLSLAFTTYQTGKLFLIGTKPDGKLSVFERTFERCMGLAVGGANQIRNPQSAIRNSQTLWMSSVYQLWRFENAIPSGTTAPDGYDALYVPQCGYTTGDVDAHDIALDHDERPVFINTLFSCIAAPSETHSFRVVWKPPFITKLAAEDRCHLNGLGGRGGNVTVRADDILLEGGRVFESKISAESVSPGDGGDGGNVDVTAGRLRIFDGARISATTFGGGDGGDVVVRAQDALISQRGTGLFTGIAAGTVSKAPGAGAGGKVFTEFDSLVLTGGGSILANTFGTGNGGSVEVKARSLALEDFGSIEASATGKGFAGSVAITVEEPLTMRSSAAVRTSSDISEAGTVAITSATSIVLEDASITVRATKGNAGSIVLMTPDRLTLLRSEILAEAGLNGGSVFIDPQYVILDHSRISANAILGAGGAITIIADTFLSSSSAVTASSEASVQGTVEIQSPDAQLANALTPLSASFVGIETRLQERCAMRLGGDFSTFLLVGRGGTPPAPEDILLSPTKLQLDTPRR